MEYTPAAYLQSDLDMLFSNFSKNQRQKTPLEYDIDGGFQQHTTENPGVNGEPALDLEYAMALVNPVDVTLYQIPYTVSFYPVSVVSF